MDAANFTVALLGTQLVGSGVIGFISGYGLKKVAKLIFKILAAITGIAVAFIAFLSFKGIITVNWYQLMAALADFLNSAVALTNQEALPVWNFLAQNVAITGGFGAGFLLGVSKG